MSMSLIDSSSSSFVSLGHTSSGSLASSSLAYWSRRAASTSTTGWSIFTVVACILSVVI
eukprot:CAMPEP_0203765114 /NCGR_PEP_ID=MMETSP0098-20131031/18235_1 /ASSEMBLY_ACC=CAM_ASM_000208 /TAXON_ID=96639 /ORGANISM=" , Strain NY0313808BC1" /LENGTH=58 /DNA_ID=CAMNT_0050661337 /DNA_START=221 /DNA_END=397 /DNA_ORIENTATION=-